uniref:Uncharacterized protein n=1 Tax=Schistosoma mansoni TaxID=6183 RepID=A0A5K4F958_SCHMA
MNLTSFHIILIIIVCTMINKIENSGSARKPRKQTTEGVKVPSVEDIINKFLNNSLIEGPFRDDRDQMFYDGRE